MGERTLSIIKPNATVKGVAGQILSRFEKEGFGIVAMRQMSLTKKQAAGFYYVHKRKPFFKSLIKFMTSGPVIVFVLEGENIIERLRAVMGATDPAKARKGTIRARFGENIERNCVHGSDSPESARFEIGYFFAGSDLVG
jgi:nucleoside-diphosphate kinase